MFRRRIQNFVSQPELVLPKFVTNLTNSSKHPFLWYSTRSSSAVLFQKLKKSERKPLVTSINELKRAARLRAKAKQNVEENSLQPPANGLLVKGLVPIAHEVYAARSELFSCISTVIKRSIVHCCRVCGGVHIGHPPHKIRTCNVAGSAPNKEHTWEIGGIQHVFPTVESFHLYDRIGRAVSHNEQLQVDRIPAVVELCIQAGVDIPEYPTRRRTFPIYNVAGRTVDFEKRFPKKFTLEKGVNSYGFWNDKKTVCVDTLSINSDDLKGFSSRILKRTLGRGFHSYKKYFVPLSNRCGILQSTSLRGSASSLAHRPVSCNSSTHCWQILSSLDFPSRTLKRVYLRGYHTLNILFASPTEG